jgi:ABC-type glycerol-3-phosphate transport system substrate-binding protein
MKRFLPFIIIGILLLVLVVTAGVVFVLTREKETGPVVLRYVGLWDPEVINPLKAEFQSSHPNVIIEYEQKDQDRYYSYLKPALSNKNGPDIFWWHDSWGPILINKLSPLPNEVLSEAEFERTFYPVTRENLKLSGAYRGIPLEFDGLALLYNKDMLKAKGFAGPPADFVSLKYNYAPRLVVPNEEGKVKIGGIAVGTVNNIDHFSEIVGLFLLQNKVSFVQNGVNTFALNVSLDKRNLASDALGSYLSFTSKDKVWSSALPPSLEAFAESKVAMVYLPAYRITELNDYLQQNNLKLNYGVAAVPQLVKSEPVTWASYWVNGVNSDSLHQAEAWEFVKFLSEEDSLQKLFQNEKQLRGIGRAYPRVEMASQLSQDPILSPYLVQAKKAKNWYLNSNTGDTDLNGKIVTIFATRLSQNAESSEQGGAVNDISKDMQPILNQFGLTR